MGLFQSKKKPKDNSRPDEAALQEFFDANFREELRNHGRWYFEKVISENGELFKADLEATIAEVRAGLNEHVTKQLDTAIAQVSTDLKAHTTQQLEDRINEQSQTLREAQDEALRLMTQSAQALQDQHQQTADALKKSIAEQQATLSAAFEESKAEIAKMKDTQGLALQWLAKSVQVLQEQHQQMSETLQKNVAEQEAIMVDIFEQNMARVIEHYLLNAIGDEYDLKAQLPSIIQQMETNKQAIVDDIKL